MEIFPEFIRTPAEWLGNHPVFLLMAVALFLLALARLRNVFPNPRAWGLLVVSLVGSMLVIIWPAVFYLVLAFDIVIGLVALVDLWMIPSGRKIAVERELAKTASIAKDHPVTLTISNSGRKPIELWLRDDLPQQLVTDREEFHKTIPAQSRMIVKYDFQAQRRGKFELHNVYLMFHSRLRFWKRVTHQEVYSVVHVYPDLKQLSEYAVLARKNKLSMMGLRRTRRIGQDNEFERLRDYTSDDNFKHIDWRTTARRNKLTVRDFQANQSQRVIFMLDCGRMMTNTSSGLNLLDHALNATLMLSYIALQKGDSVGLICFSDRVHSYVPPRSGMGQMNQLLYAMFDRDPDLVESRYDQAFLYLATNCLRRSLVVLISNVIDEVNSMQIEKYLSSIVGRHLPMGVLLRDHQLFNAADREPESVAEIYSGAVAAEILTWRHQVLTDLEHKGVIALDVFPEDMTAPMINRYLEIKARHLL